MRKRAKLKAFIFRGGGLDPLQASTRAPHPLVVASLSSNPRSFDRLVGRVTRYLRPSIASRPITRELVILGLQSLKESSPACPPLQGVVGGLLKLVETYETMTQNVDDCLKLYERVDAIQESLVTAWGDADLLLPSLSEAQLKALIAFDESVQAILRDVDSLAARGSHLLRRFILARKHKAQISDCLSKLTETDNNFRRTIELDASRLITRMHRSMTAASQLAPSEHHLALYSEMHAQRTLLSTALIGLFA